MEPRSDLRRRVPPSRFGPDKRKDFPKMYADPTIGEVESRGQTFAAREDQRGQLEWRLAQAQRRQRQSFAEPPAKRVNIATAGDLSPISEYRRLNNWRRLESAFP